MWVSGLGGIKTNGWRQDMHPFGMAAVAFVKSMVLDAGFIQPFAIAAHYFHSILQLKQFSMRAESS